MFGGTTRKLSKARWPQREKLVALAVALVVEVDVGQRTRGEVPNASTCTEWSITSSTGCSGLIRAGSPPSSAMASRMAARSTTAGTPVKSCSSTRAGVKAISRSGGLAGRPAGQRLDIVPGNGDAVFGAEQVFQQDAQGVRQASDVDSVPGQSAEPEDLEGSAGRPVSVDRAPNELVMFIK